MKARTLFLLLLALALLAVVPAAMADDTCYEGTFVLEVSAEETAQNSMHGGLLTAYPCTTVNTLTLTMDGTYTWTKEVRSEEAYGLEWVYTFTGTYAPGKANKLELNPAEHCVYSENYGTLEGASEVVEIANRAGDDTTDPLCLEYFGSCYVVWGSNNAAKVALDLDGMTFTMKDHNDQWGVAWKDENEERIAVYLAQTDEMQGKGGIIFYGASNFRLWKNMQTDMAPYTVMNHGVGGSVDTELMEFAPTLLYPFEPRAVFIQTGSNDYTGGATLEECLANKEKLFGLFAENLPNTQFIIMAGLPLPSRAEYWDLTVQVNNFLAEYCATHENFTFVDGTDAILTDHGDESMATGDGRYFNPEIFNSDGIHLTQEGHDLWTPYMLNALEELGIEP